MISPFGLKRSSWLWHVTLLSFVLGMLLAAALKTQQTIKFKSGLPTTRFPALARAWADEKERNETLQKEITDLRAKLNRYEQTLGAGGSTSGVLSDELQNARFQAGLLQAEGPGVIVTLQDSNRRPPSDASPELMDDYNIHDYDIRDFVNELLASGAEAIAVNDQRIIASTSIRCAGTRILINNAPMSPPFIITAIGPAADMENGLRMRGGVVDMFRIMEDLSDMVKIERSGNLGIPAYSGSTHFNYAKPVKLEGEGKP
jgi:uncharacterized protein YlxW (UPF0749 family)